MEDLPELPEPAAYRWTEFQEYRFSSLPPMHVPMGLQRLHTDEVMREYARKAVLAERERLARLCEDLPAWNMDDPGETAAAAIRSSGGN